MWYALTPSRKSTFEHVRTRQNHNGSELNTTMKFPRVLVLPLVAASMLFATAGLHAAPVVSASQSNSAHSKRPARFHYVCPMHEDVTSKTRGKKCPKCKMKLERRRVKEPTETPDQ